MNGSIIAIQRAKYHRKQMWFNPKVAVHFRKNKPDRALYDTGERLPGGIPVLAVRKEER